MRSQSRAATRRLHLYQVRVDRNATRKGALVHQRLLALRVLIRGDPGGSVRVE